MPHCWRAGMTARIVMAIQTGSSSLRSRVAAFNFRTVFQFGPDHVLNGFFEIPFAGPFQFGLRLAGIAAKSGGHLLGGTGAFGRFDELAVIKSGGAEGAL